MRFTVVGLRAGPRLRRQRRSAAPAAGDDRTATLDKGRGDGGRRRCRRAAAGRSCRLASALGRPVRPRGRKLRGTCGSGGRVRGVQSRSPTADQLARRRAERPSGALVAGSGRRQARIAHAPTATAAAPIQNGACTLTSSPSRPRRTARPRRRRSGRRSTPRGDRALDGRRAHHRLGDDGVVDAEERAGDDHADHQGGLVVGQTAIIARSRPNSVSDTRTSGSSRSWRWRTGADPDRA